jgi:hypothetical protein
MRARPGIQVNAHFSGERSFPSEIVQMFRGDGAALPVHPSATSSKSGDMVLPLRWGVTSGHTLLMQKSNS